MAIKDGAKPAEISQEEQKIAEKMIRADITQNIPMSLSEWDALCQLLSKDGVIIRSQGGKVTVEKEK